ncbi:MAG: Com family DNA-binding transcriptional regulator [Burkholderiales bacterium]
MNEIRCGACARKLGEGQFTLLSIKCPRCGTLNHLRAMSPLPERPGASNLGDKDGSNSWGQKPIGMAGRQKPPG